MLNTMRAIFRDVEMHQQAEVMQKEVRALLEDVGRLETRVTALGKHFKAVERDVDQIEISMRGIVRHGERIDELEFEEASEPRIAGPDVGTGTP